MTFIFTVNFIETCGLIRVPVEITSKQHKVTEKQENSKETKQTTIIKSCFI